MASRAFQPAAKTLTPGAFRICGKFTVGAAGAVGTVSLKGCSGVTHTAAGVYTLALYDTPYNLVSGGMQLMHTAATGLYSEISAWGGTLNFYTCDGVNTATDPPNGATVFIDAILTNTQRSLASA